MDRRSFIKTLSAFVAVATVAPKSLAIQPIDWQEWNGFELYCDGGEITRMTINEKDFTRSLEARQKLAQVMRFEEDGIVFARDGHGTKFVISRNLPERFTMGFQLRFTPNAPPPVAINGDLSQQFVVSDIFAVSPVPVTSPK